MNFYQSVSANKAVNVQRFLDTYTGAVAAYSLRRLRTGHTGYAVEVRRASDNSTRDVGFDPDGNFDVSALQEFCSGTDGYVTVWYDQTSNGYDVSQTDTTKQPKIHDSVTGLIPLTDAEGNGVPNTLASIKGDSSSILSNSSLQEEFNGGYSYFLVNNCSTYNTLLFYTDTGTSNKTFGALGSTYQFVRHRNVSKITSPAYRTDRRSTIFSVHHDGSTGYNAFTIQETGENGSHSSSQPTLDSTASGVSLQINPRNASMQELIIYDSDKSSQRKEIESAINSYYTIGQLNYDLPLDTYTNVLGAWSVRKVRSAYTGYCMEVYNGTSYADIGFTDFNELDVDAIATHCGTNDGYVSKIYDQSGNSHHATQTDVAVMPKIYNGTSQTVFFENGKPQIQGDSYAASTRYTYMAVSGEINGYPNGHTFTVMQRSSTTNADLQCLFAYGRYANRNQARYSTQLSNGGPGGTGTNLYINGVPNSADKKNSFGNAISNSAVIVNSNHSYNVDIYTALMNLGAGSPVNMQHLQELLIFDDDMADDREAIEQNQNSYFSVF